MRSASSTERLTATSRSTHRSQITTRPATLPLADRGLRPNGTGGPSDCQRTGRWRLRDTPLRAYHRDPARAPVVPLDPPFPAAWDPVPRTRSRRRSSGSRPTRASSGSDPATRWTASRPSSTCSSAGSAGDRAPRPRPRDDRLPRRPVLAARGRPVGHHRAGRRAAGRDAVRRRHRRIPAYASCGMLLPRGRAGRVRAPTARRGIPRAEDPDRSRAGWRTVSRPSPRPGPPSATRWRSWST